jgi:hypothetical protein
LIASILFRQLLHRWFQIHVLDLSKSTLYRGLARGVTDGCRHVGSIFRAARDVLMEITLENGHTFQILTAKSRFDLMHWNASICHDKWPIFGSFF